MVCERYQSWITDAALGALAPGRAAEFSVHVRECAACHAELNRVQALLAAIDSGAAASMAAEPSPAMVARVRQRIAEEAAAPRWRITSWVPVAAGALALLLAIGVWVTRRQPANGHGVAPSDVAGNSSKSVPAAAPRHRTEVTSAANPAVVAPAHSRRPRASVGAPPTVSREPEILVPAEEWRSVVDLYAAMQSGRVDGTVLVAAAKNLDKPVTLDKLKIAPLEVPRPEENDN